MNITQADFGTPGTKMHYMIQVANGFDGVIYGNISGSGNYGAQLLIADNKRFKYRSLSNGVYESWESITTNTDLAVAKVITDLHNIGASCMFYYDAGAKNAPSNNYGGTGICIRARANWEMVIVIQYAQTQMYIAEKHGDIWSNWSGPK